MTTPIEHRGYRILPCLNPITGYWEATAHIKDGVTYATGGHERRSDAIENVKYYIDTYVVGEAS